MFDNLCYHANNMRTSVDYEKLKRKPEVACGSVRGNKHDVSFSLSLSLSLSLTGLCIALSLLNAFGALFAS